MWCWGAIFSGVDTGARAPPPHPWECKRKERMRRKEGLVNKHNTVFWVGVSHSWCSVLPRSTPPPPYGLTNGTPRATFMPFLIWLHHNYFWHVTRLGWTSYCQYLVRNSRGNARTFCKGWSGVRSQFTKSFAWSKKVPIFTYSPKKVAQKMGTTMILFADIGPEMEESV